MHYIVVHACGHLSVTQTHRDIHRCGFVSVCKFLQSCTHTHTQAKSSSCLQDYVSSLSSGFILAGEAQFRG